MEFGPFLNSHGRIRRLLIALLREARSVIREASGTYAREFVAVYSGEAITFQGADRAATGKFLALVRNH
jgi:hypothetical protein